MTSHDFRKRPAFYTAVFLLILFLVSACTSAPLKQARDDFYYGRPERAAKTLAGEKGPYKKDHLLFLMERGLVLHYLGHYEESTRVFLEATQFMEEQGILSVSRESGSLLINDWIKEYKGEYSERLWVHTYLIMNYLLLHQEEDALVEAKQALSILENHPISLSGDYFTRALIALCYENLGEANDAYIEYKKLAKLMPDPSPIIPRLYEQGRKLGFFNEIAPYRKSLPGTDIYRPEKESAEIVLFAALGKAPVKIPGNFFFPPSIRFSFPRYQGRYNLSEDILVFDSEKTLPSSVVTTDIHSVAAASLEARAVQIAAKEMLRVSVKEGAAQAVEKKKKKENKAAGGLLRTAFLVMEEPDTRSWQTLPAYLKLIRIRLEPGKHNLSTVIYNRYGRVMRKIALPTFDLAPGQRVYYSIRFSE